MYIANVYTFFFKTSRKVELLFFSFRIMIFKKYCFKGDEFTWITLSKRQIILKDNIRFALTKPKTNCRKMINERTHDK